MTGARDHFARLFLATIALLFVLDRRDVSDRFDWKAIVEPGDPFQSRKLTVFEIPATDPDPGSPRSRNDRTYHMEYRVTHAEG